MIQSLTLGQQLAQRSLEVRKKKLRSKKAWSEYMKRVRAGGADKLDKRS